MRTPSPAARNARGAERREPGPWRRALIDLGGVVGVLPAVFAVRSSVRAAWLTLHPPHKPVQPTPERYGLKHERVMVAGADGVRLACWFIPSPGARDGVVLGHGLNRDSGMLMSLAKALHEAGYHVLTFDMRNHGESADDGLRRGQSPRFAVDFGNVVQHFKQRPEMAGGRAACLGMSMSAWTALDVARLDPGFVRAVICDSGPTLDIGDTLQRMFEARRGRLPAWQRGPLMYRIARGAYRRAALYFLKPAPWPVPFTDHSIRLLFISGAADPVARPQDVERQLAWYPQADHWLVPRAGHNTCHIMAADEYAERVLAVLAAAFADQPNEGSTGHGVVPADREPQ
ncbi:alpha/beta fold hydrolase [Actinocrinis puniceicyclus]|uniref:Alpha/beta fold hydrolase n=1 Tax=Actinocrinis puniceicyclus TaxID=977794 RepID=A0A8J8B9Y8_9ACTN|nr:alpha/beta fold hydrolase [Actinocrinis puniceicyclus]MBS2962347.1 alpha/beta fold hydrolase [Actinocrinis puniceicyclus]